jgi:hypothetical protein
MVELSRYIRTRLEGDKDFSIDKKTVKRITDHLVEEELLAYQEVRVTVSYQGCDSEDSEQEICNSDNSDF